MAENLEGNVKKKLSQSKEKCPGLNEEVYMLTDYIENIIGDECEPLDMLVCLVLSLADVRRGRSGFVSYEYKELPIQMEERRAQILAQAVYFPQIVDAVFSESFAKEFRIICKTKLGYDPPKREKIYDPYEHIEGNYPEYVIVAVNWWANAIRHPKFDNGNNDASEIKTRMLTQMVNAKSKITQWQIEKFKQTLAKKILQIIENSQKQKCIISVEYEPDDTLYASAKEAGIKETESFPWITHMTITPKKVSVSEGYNAEWKTIWSKEFLKK